MIDLILKISSYMKIAGLLIQAYAFFYAYKHSKKPTPKKFEEIYFWLTNNENKYLQKMEKGDPMYNDFTKIVTNKNNIKKEITLFEFRDMRHFNDAKVSSWSNGSRQSDESISSIVDYIKQEGKDEYWMNASKIYLAGLLVNIIGLCLDYNWIAFHYFIMGFLCGLCIFFYTKYP